MLKKLKVKNFTVFKEAEFEFIDGLNVVIGANGTGKSHLLKLAYACMKLSKDLGAKPTKATLQIKLADYLKALFLPDWLGRLVTRARGHNVSEVEVEFQVKKSAYGFSFSTRSSAEISFIRDAEAGVPYSPIFIPPKEVLTFYPWLLGQYDDREISIDQTYPDLCRLLQKALLRGPRFEKVAGVAKSLEDMIGGRIRVENNRFYLFDPDTGMKLEINLVAEGKRKLGLLAYLLLNGSLNDRTTLFWDEPEANLNNVLVKDLARLLMQLSDKKYQLVIATHSLFLLKELHILSKQANTPVRFFSLSEQGNNLNVHMSDDLGEVPEIPALDAELEQSGRFSI